MKQISIEINKRPVTVKVSKWMGRPGANGIHIIARESLSTVKKCLEDALNIDIYIYIEDFGLYIPECDAIHIDEGIIISYLKNAKLN